MEDWRYVDAGSVAGSQDTPKERKGALEYLQDIYNDPRQSTPTRMRAAAECLPFESRKLTPTTIAVIDGLSFADALERCIARSQAPLPLPAPTVIEHSPDELKGPMARLERRF
jgi:hypothetical protein